MDEVELISVANNYLNELGYDLDEKTALVNDKIVSYRNVKKEKLDNDPRNNIIINDIDVFIDNNIVLVMETSSSYLYFNRRDFSRDECSRLSEKIISTSYSFTKVRDRVIKSCNRKVTNLLNGNIVNKLNNSYMDSIEVDLNYKLTDGYPFKRKDKKLIKE